MTATNKEAAGTFAVSAPPPVQSIAFLSGMGVQPRMWRRIYFERLRKHGFEPLLVDYKPEWFAHGKRPSVEQLAQLCLAEIETLLSSRPILVGFSAGALVAQEIAKRMSQMLTGLVLIAPFSELLAVQRVAMELEAGVNAGNQAARSFLALLDVLQLSSRAELFEDAVFSSRYTAMLHRDLASPVDVGLFSAVHSYRSELAALAQVRCPTLVLAFSDDLMVPPPCSRRVAQAIPGAVFTEIEDAGHVGPLSHHETVFENLLGFCYRSSVEVSDQRYAFAGKKVADVRRA